MSPPNLTTTPENDEMRGAELARQDEITAREGVEDDISLGGEQRQQPDPERIEPEPGERRAIPMSPADEMRANIAKRFNRGESVPFDGDMTNPENLYGSVAQQHEDVDPDAPEPGVPAGESGQQQERTHKITIRGQVVELTDTQLIERASKVEAADSYFAEGRALLEAAKQVKKELAAPDSQHPDGRQAADDGQDRDTRATPRRPGEDTLEVVKDLQFGDPEEAADKLNRLIDARADQRANEGHLQRLVNNDLAKAQKSLRDFTAANPQIANDEDASMLMENHIYKIYRDDIAKLGVVDEAQIPKDPKTLADWHRYYRVHGQPVSSIPDVLSRAKEHVVKRLGVSGEPPQPVVRPKGAPNVEVNVDRTARRAAIPNQPNRAVAPRRDAQAPQGKTPASNVINDMRRARGQPVV